MALVLAKCTSCGTTLQVESAMEAAVCPHCKTAFVVEKAIQNYNTSHGVNGVVIAQATAETPEKKTKKSNTGIIIAVIIAVAILFASGVVLYAVISDNDSSHSSSEQDSDKSPENDPSPEDDEVETGALKGMYVSESGLYKVEFSEDFTCIWYQEVHGNDNVFFNGTYKYENGTYILHMNGESYAYNTRFDAVPTEDGLIVTGGVVYGELFVKQ